MKKLLFILMLVVFYGCDTVNHYKPEEQTKNTTVQILDLAKKDSVLYKKINVEGKIYILNNNTNLVENEFHEDDTHFITFLFFLLSYLFVFIVGVIFGRD